MMSIYSLATLGWPDNRITFNDFDNFPVYRAQTRAPRSFDIRDNDIPIPFESGVSDFRTLVGKSMYVISGTMYPRDESDYENGIAALRAVCSLDLNNQSDYNTDDGYIPYIYSEVTGDKLIMVKPIYVQMIENVRQGFVQPFNIICKIKDPTIYGNSLKNASTQESDASASSGAAEYSFTYPVVFGSTIYNVSSDATNNGNIPTYPTSINIYGPATNPKLTNQLTGEFIQINTTLSSQSDVIAIAYDKDSLTVTKNGNNVLSDVTTDSTYFKIYPGNNIVTLSGASVGTGAYAVVFYRDAFALP